MEKTGRPSPVFLPYSRPGGPDHTKWAGHLTPPAQLPPATVQSEVEKTKFEKIFVDLMSH
jgi:hypothetical protein